MDIKIENVNESNMDLVLDTVESVFLQLDLKAMYREYDPGTSVLTFCRVEKLPEEDQPGSLFMAAARSDLRDRVRDKKKSGLTAEFLDSLLFDGKKKEGPGEKREGEERCPGTLSKSPDGYHCYNEYDKCDWCGEKFLYPKELR